jgi:predicted transcriptional regulator
MSDLGPLQKEVIEVMWNLRRASVQDVLDEINKKRINTTNGDVRKCEPLAYTTVMTVMTQLWEKRLLTRRKIGRAYVYRPTSDKRGYVVSRIQEFFDTLLGRGETTVASHLLDALEDEGKINELLDELKNRKYIE